MLGQLMKSFIEHRMHFEDLYDNAVQNTVPNKISHPQIKGYQTFVFSTNRPRSLWGKTLLIHFYMMVSFVKMELCVRPQY